MDNKARNIVQNVGAIAETVSVFYNSIAKQVPKDVALVLTQHFMYLTINRRGGQVINENVAAAIAAVQAQEAKRRAMEQKKQQNTEPENPPSEEPKQD